MRAVNLMLGVGGTIAVGSVGASTYLFRKTILRGAPIAVSKEPGLRETNWQQYFPRIRESKAWLKQQNTEDVHVDTFDGLRLRGIWLPAEEESNKLIIGLHGYKSRGESDFSALSKFYHEQGYHVLIVDHRAHGRSEGKYIGFGVLDRKDCRKWIELGLEKLGAGCEIYLHGISMGAATALLTSGSGRIEGKELPSQVKGVIADCAFTSAWDVFAHILKKTYHQPPFPILYLANNYCRQLAGYAFDEVNNLELVQNISVPVLFIHGTEDDFVPTDMSRRMYAAKEKDKEIFLVEGAGHGESYYADSQRYEEKVLEFLKTCSQKM